MKKVIISVVIIQIVLIAALLIHYNNNVSKLELKPKPDINVSHFTQSGVSSFQIDDDLSKKGIVLRFQIQNNIDEAYNFNEDSIYLQVEDEKIFKSNLEEASVKLDKLTAQTIEPKSKVYGYLVFIVPWEIEDEDYDIYFDDGNESYILQK